MQPHARPPPPPCVKHPPPRKVHSPLMHARLAATCQAWMRPSTCTPAKSRLFWAPLPAFPTHPRQRNGTPAPHISPQMPPACGLLPGPQKAPQARAPFAGSKSLGNPRGTGVGDLIGSRGSLLGPPNLKLTGPVDRGGVLKRSTHKNGRRHTCVTGNFQFSGLKIDDQFHNLTKLTFHESHFTVINSCAASLTVKSRG